MVQVLVLRLAQRQAPTLSVLTSLSVPCQSSTIFSTVLTFVKLFNQSKEMYKRLKKAQERHQRRVTEVRRAHVLSTGRFVSLRSKRR